jgi:hypothetical protein
VVVVVDARDLDLRRARAPDVDYENAPPLTGANVSNGAFWWLFPNYLQSEDIFVVPSSAWTPNAADNPLDAATDAAGSETLEAAVVAPAALAT